MRNPEKLVKPGILSLKPYSYNQIEAEVKLNQNESPYDLPGDLKEEIFRKVSRKPWNRYPDKIGKPVRDAIAEYINVDPARIIVGVGSDEILGDIAGVAINKSRKTLIIEPTFSMYRYCASQFESDVISLTANSDLSYPVPEITQTAAQSDIGVTFIATPNNPTGSVLTFREAEAIAESANGIVVFDEAYCEFSQINLIPLQDKYPNVIITRTFSKAFGMAGLRLGFMVANPNLNKYIYRIKKPFSVNVFTETAAIELLCNKDLVRNRIARIKRDTETLRIHINNIPGLKSNTQYTNFLLVESEFKGSELTAKLAELGIAARDMSSYPLLENYFRVNTGTEEENNTLINSLQEIMKPE